MQNLFIAENSIIYYLAINCWIFLAVCKERFADEGLLCFGCEQQAGVQNSAGAGVPSGPWHCVSIFIIII